MTISVRAMEPCDWPAVEAIYAAGIATRNATFETEPPTWKHFDTSKRPDQRWVAVDEEVVVGWVAAGQISPRAVYAGAVEHSVYIDPDHQGYGVGRLLLHALIASTEGAGIWTIQSSVFPENTASLALHAPAGSGRSAGVSGSDSTSAAGATSSSSNAVARASGPDRSIACVLQAKSPGDR